MTYRIQSDLSFINKADADKYIADIKALGDKIYYPTLEEITNRADLWTYNRLTLIRDYDDEGENQVGTGDVSREILKPADLVESIAHKELVKEVIIYKDAIVKEVI